MPNPKSLKKLQEVSRREILLSIARDPDTGRVYSGASDAAVHHVDLSAEKPEPVAWEGHESYVTGVAITGEQLVSVGYDQRMIWRNRKSGEITRQLDEAHGRWIRGVASSPDGATLATVGDDMVCRLWNAADGSVLHELRGHAEKTPQHYPSMLYACAFSPDGKHLATADRLGKAIVWDVQQGVQLAAVEGSEMYTWDPRARRHSIGGARSVAFSPDGKSLAVGGMGKVGNIDHLQGKARVEVFAWESGERQQLFDDFGYKGLVEQVAFGPDGKWLLAAGGDHSGFLAFLDLASGKGLNDQKFGNHVHAFVTNDDWSQIAVAAHGRWGLFAI